MPGPVLVTGAALDRSDSSWFLFPRARGHCRRSQDVPSSILHKD